MNLLKVKAKEVWNDAKYLLLELISASKGGQMAFGAMPILDGLVTGIEEYLREVGSIGGRRSEQLAPELQDICELAKAHIRNESFQWEHLHSLRRSLNSRITHVIPSQTAYQDRSMGAWYIQVRGKGVRFAAERLLRYLRHFEEERRLSKTKPVGVCPSCDGLFLKFRSNQKYCSDKCRFEVWTKEHPGYWHGLAETHAEQRKTKERIAGTKNGVATPKVTKRSR